MAKPSAWIIVKKLNNHLAWNHWAGKWDTLALASVFHNQDYLLPQGGKWVPWATNPNYEWSEGPLMNT